MFLLAFSSFVDTCLWTAKVPWVGNICLWTANVPWIGSIWKSDDCWWFNFLLHCQSFFLARTYFSAICVSYCCATLFISLHTERKRVTCNVKDRFQTFYLLSRATFPFTQESLACLELIIPDYRKSKSTRTIW